MILNERQFLTQIQYSLRLRNHISKVCARVRSRSPQTHISNQFFLAKRRSHFKQLLTWLLLFSCITFPLFKEAKIKENKNDRTEKRKNKWKSRDFPRETIFLYVKFCTSFKRFPIKMNFVQWERDGERKEKKKEKSERKRERESWRRKKERIDREKQREKCQENWRKNGLCYKWRFLWTMQSIENRFNFIVWGIKVNGSISTFFFDYHFFQFNQVKIWNLQTIFFFSS